MGFARRHHCTVTFVSTLRVGWRRGGGCCVSDGSVALPSRCI
jgi:hypothetical protein